MDREALQKHYEAMIARMEPLMPKPGLTAVEYAGAMQAFLTCAVTVAMRSYHVTEEQGKPIILRAYQQICQECDAASSPLTQHQQN